MIIIKSKAGVPIRLTRERWEHIIERHPEMEDQKEMETLKILEKKQNLNWYYDEEADVLYISVGEPVKAVGLDMGEGVIVRYKEDSAEVVGITIIGVKQRSLSALEMVQ